MTGLLGAGDVAAVGEEGTDFVLEARGLTSGYGKAPVLRDLDFAVRRGEVVALLGANGAGKTTLIMTLAGEIKAMSGDVYVDGQRETSSLDTRVRRSGIAVLAQEKSIFMTLTGRQNIKLGGAEVDDVLELFPELEPHIGRRAGLLSGGQQQMLAVGRAICCNPRVVLADEVSIGLAPMITDRLLSTLYQVAGERGIAVVLVEQFVQKALRFSDRAYVLRRGAMVLEGASEDLKANPEQIFEHYI